MRAIKYILNSPYSVLGLCNVVFCIPYAVELKADALVFRTLTCGLVRFGFPKVRGFAIGNIVVVRKGQPKSIVDHELVHVEQYMRTPLLFGLLYLWELRKGYWNNKYEIEAYDRTNTWPSGRKK